MNTIKAFFMYHKRLVTLVSGTILGMVVIFTLTMVLMNAKLVNASNASADASFLHNSIITVAELNDIKDSNKGTTIELEEIPSYNEESDIYEEETLEDIEEPVKPIDPSTSSYSLPYIIKVNRAANCVTVYTKDSSGEYTVPVKAITVSCGKVLGNTPLGTYQTTANYGWRKMVDGSYAQYAYRIVGKILFHSVPYYSQSNDNLEWAEYNQLGSSASLGCVRMTVADAIWLMYNCPIGTQVIIYDDAGNPGPLGKPETIKIPADSPYRGWDPTDPNPANPWHTFSASIACPASGTVTVKPGASKSEILSFFSATDTCGNDISSKLKISDNFDLSQAGIYSNVVVSVTDAIGSHAEVSITIIVEGQESVPIPDEPSDENVPPSDNPSEGTDSGDAGSENPGTGNTGTGDNGSENPGAEGTGSGDTGAGGSDSGGAGSGDPGAGNTGSEGIDSQNPGAEVTSS